MNARNHERGSHSPRATGPSGPRPAPAARIAAALGARVRSWEGFLAVLLLCIIATNALTSPSFLTAENQVNLFALSIEKVIVALIMTFVILNAEIDLSVASMMGLSACALGWLVQQGVPDAGGDPGVPLHRDPRAAHSTGSGSPSSVSRPWW